MSQFTPPPASPLPAGHNLPLPGGMPPYAVLVFLKSLATPIVLYSEQPLQLYEELQALMTTAQPGRPKVVEKPGMGPLRKVSFLDTELAGVALQADPSLGAMR